MMTPQVTTLKLETLLTRPLEQGFPIEDAIPVITAQPESIGKRFLLKLGENPEELASFFNRFILSASDSSQRNPLLTPDEIQQLMDIIESELSATQDSQKKLEVRDRFKEIRNGFRQFAQIIKEPHKFAEALKSTQETLSARIHESRQSFGDIKTVKDAFKLVDQTFSFGAQRTLAAFLVWSAALLPFFVAWALPGPVDLLIRKVHDGAFADGRTKHRGDLESAIQSINTISRQSIDEIVCKIESPATLLTL